MPADIGVDSLVSQSLTVYSGGFALVREERRLPSFPEDGVFRYLGVAPRIEAESVLVEGTEIRWISYEYDLADKNKLLEKYIGREVTVADRKTGVIRRLRLLSAQNGLVLEDTVSGELVVEPEGELRLPKLPGGLAQQPSLVWQALPDGEESGLVRVSYLTDGLTWEAEYVMLLPPEAGAEETFSLTGRMAVTNESGRSFEEVTLSAVAGSVRRTASGPVPRMAYGAAVQSKGLPEPEAFADYHLYPVPFKVTLNEGQTKQIGLMEAERVHGKIIYEATYRAEKPDVVLVFRNSEENGLGVPLPEGRVWMYRRAAGGPAEFIGEDRIGNKAKDETVRVIAGRAFDITIDSGLADSTVSGRYVEETYVYEIRNAKESDVEVLIRHAVHVRDWELVESNFPAERRFDEVRITAEVKAGGTATVLFKIRLDRGVAGGVSG